MTTPKSLQRLHSAQDLLVGGKVDEALNILTKLARKHPRWDRALYLLGLCQIRLGDQTKAEQWYRKALAANPKLPEALFDLGNLHLLRNDFFMAEELYARGLAVYPDQPSAVSSRAVCLAFTERPAEAEPLAKDAAARLPKDVTAQCNLGLVLMRCLKWDDALAAFEKAAGLNPRHFATLEGLLTTAERANRLPDYRDYLDKALEIAPDSNSFQLMTIHLQRQDGETAAAIKALTKLIEKNESRVTDLASQKEVLKNARQRDKEGLRRIEDEIRGIGWSLGKFYYELGSLENAAKRWDDAFRSFERSNALTKEYNPDWRDRRDFYLAGIEQLERGFANGAFEFLGGVEQKEALATHPKLLFEVGFPRSGTTLLESILDAHPQCIGMDESTAFSKTIGHLAKMGKTYPDDLGSLTDQDIKGLQTVYFDHVAPYISAEQRADKTWIIDKSPLNMVHAGFIRKVFPSAKILLVLRHPMDCGLSCFMQNFSLTESMASFLSLEDTFSFYDRVFRLWSRYADSLSSDVSMSIRYEDLVEDRETHLKSLLSWMGLDWTEAVMDHRGTGKLATGTPSYRQISQPVYRQSVARWKRFESHLRPYEKIVAEHMKRFGYLET